MTLHAAITDGGPLVGVSIGRAHVRAGWGYDADLPLRPWPAVHRSDRGRLGSDVCAAWFGFYVGLRWVSR
jgi:hypothetical protein